MAFSMWTEQPSPGNFEIRTEKHRHVSENIACLFCEVPIPENAFKCPQCKIVRYCNKKCHLGHWTKHKLPCERFKQYRKNCGHSCLISGSPSANGGIGYINKPSKTDLKEKGKGEAKNSKILLPRQCSSCNRCSLGLRPCSKCKSVQYCDTDCQRNHWPEHKKTCKSICKGMTASQSGGSGHKPQSDAASAETSLGKGLEVKEQKAPEDKRCSMCKKLNPDAKNCSKCKSACYCNAECQRKHWPLHKEVCGRVDHKKKDVTPQSEALDKDIQCFYCKQKNPNAKKCTKCQFAYYCNKQCQRNGFSDHKLACGNYPKFVEALSRSNMELSNLHDRDITELVYPPRLYGAEFGLFLNPGTKGVLLEIVSPFHHFCRLGVYVQDVKGETYHMLFHHKSDEEIFLIPSTLKEALEPGNFIRWFYPRWHLFGDGEIGFRIDSLFEMEFIRKKFKLFEF